MADSSKHVDDDGEGVPVEVRELSLMAGPRTLLARATARFEAGQITLIVGPSGAGKSLLLRVLAGLVPAGLGEVRVTGQVLLGGKTDDPSRQRSEPVGVVFQNFALFDELSPLDNVRFAAAHRRARGRSASRHAASPAVLLDELRVPRDVRTASLSGGQRQRLAIARALAYDPQVILYDEPTSGLDVASALQVSELIRSTHAAHRKTSIVVTHDYESLSRIADRIYLFDPTQRALVEVPRDDWPRLGELLTDATHGLAMREDAAPDKPPSRLRSELGAAIGDAGNFLEGTSRFVERVAMLPLRLWPMWRSVPWGLRFLAHYLRLVADPSAWVYVAVAGAILGFVSTYFTFRFLPYRSYTEPLIIENLLHALGFTLYRILVPALATILIAARCGAAVASDVGGKAYGQQLASLQTFGARPTRYLATNILYAFLLGTPILVAISFTAARWTSLLVFSSTHAEFGPFFWDAHFHRELIAPGQWFYRGTAWLAAKVLCCAAGMAVIAYDRGAEEKHSSKDVSLGITSTILWATLYVLAVHLGFALFEFESEVR